MRQKDLPGIADVLKTLSRFATRMKVYWLRPCYVCADNPTHAREGCTGMYLVLMPEPPKNRDARRQADRLRERVVGAMSRLDATGWHWNVIPEQIAQVPSGAMRVTGIVQAN